MKVDTKLNLQLKKSEKTTKTGFEKNYSSIVLKFDKLTFDK